MYRNHFLFISGSQLHTIEHPTKGVILYNAQYDRKQFNIEEKQAREDNSNGLVFSRLFENFLDPNCS